MSMTRAHKDPERRPLAQEIFTDRVEERKHIADFFSALCATSFEFPDQPILSFYGVGGNGKSLLAKQAMAEWHALQKLNKPAVALNIVLCDVDIPGFTPEKLPMDFCGGVLRQSLHQMGVKVPLFDLLYTTWWGKTHPNRPLNLDEGIEGLLGTAGEVTSTVGSIFEFMGSIVAPGLQAGKLATEATKYFKKRFHKSRYDRLFENKDLDSLSERELVQFAPRLLAEDLRDYLKKAPNRALCLIVDGMERIQPDAHGKVGTEKDVQWSLKELLLWLLPEDNSDHHRFAMILLGREKLRWADLYRKDAVDWGRGIDSHFLKALAEDDARDYLHKVIDWCSTHPESGRLGPRISGNLEAVLVSANESRDAIERRFHPYSLDLAVQLIVDLGERFTPEALGKEGADKLNERFLTQMREIAPDRLKAFETFALALTFDQDLFEHLVKNNILTGYALQDFGRLIGQDLSYIREDQLTPGLYRFHDKMQEALIDSFRNFHLHAAPQAAKTVVTAIFDHYHGLMRQALDSRDQGRAKYNYDRLSTLLFHHQAKAVLDWEAFDGLFDNLERDLDEYFNLATRVEVLRKRLQWVETVRGLDHLDTSNILNNLALLLKDQGDYASAESLYRRALAIREQLLGTDHPDTARNLNNLASLLYSQGDYAGAEPLYRRALAIWELQLEPVHPDTAASLNNLAVLLNSQGNYADAELLHRRALAIWELQLGPDHPSTAASIHNLALVLENQDDAAGAETLYRRALEVCEQQLGPDHPHTATSLNSLASMLHRQGNEADAEPLYRRALAIREQQLGPVHPDTTASRDELILLLVFQGDDAGAEQLYRRELELCEQQLGPDHPHTATSLNNLAVFLRNCGNYAGAEPMLLEAIRRFSESCGDDSLNVASSNSALGKLLQLTGRIQEAHECYSKALAIRLEKLGEEDEATKLVRERINELNIEK